MTHQSNQRREASSMKNPPMPPRAMEGTPLGDAALLGVEVSEPEVESEVPDPEEEGVLALVFTSNLISLISLPV